MDNKDPVSIDFPPTLSGTELQVCHDIADRQKIGIKKYNTTVRGSDLTLRAWLQHAYEECLDQAIYLRRAIEKIDQHSEIEGAVRGSVLPHYKHECPYCKYLGSVQYYSGRFDLYFCDETKDDWMLIARFGNSTDDTVSTESRHWNSQGWSEDHPIAEAHKRAVMIGFIENE